MDLKTIGVAVALRLALSHSGDGGGVVETLESHFELSTVLTRQAEIEQQLAWPSASGGPHRPPLLVLLVKYGLTNHLFFLVIDLLVAVLLWLSLTEHVRTDASRQVDEIDQINKWEQRGRYRLDSDGNPGERDDDWTWSATSKETQGGELLSKDALPTTIASAYLLSPFTILTCAARSWAPFTFLLAMSTLYASQRAKPVWCGALWAATLYVEGPSYLIPLLVVLFRPKGLDLLWVASVLLSLGATLTMLLLVSFHVHGSWSFLDPCYLWVLSFEDLRPNVGLWWYLMSEVFPPHRSYFLLILHAFPYLLATPILVYLYHRPVLCSHFLLGVLHTFQPYPETFHVFTCLLLLFAHPQFLLHISSLGPVLLILAFSTVLQPIMLYTWLKLASGNANFFYFQTLASNGMICALLLQFYLSVLVRDAVLRRIGKYVMT